MSTPTPALLLSLLLWGPAVLFSWGPAFLARHSRAAATAAAGPTALQESPGALSQRATEAIDAGRYAEAIEIYTQLARAVPNDPHVAANLGIAQSMAGRPRDAIATLERAVKLRPALMNAWMFLGAAYLDVGEPKHAVGALEKVLAAQPANADARRMLAGALLSLDRYQDASRHYRRLTDEHGNDPRAWYGLGRSYQGQGELALERLQQRAPDSPFAAILMAEVFAAQRRTADALRLYAAAADELPEFVDVHLAMADLYERTGQPDRAAEAERKARAIPEEPCVTRRPECEFRAGRYLNVLASTRNRQDAEALYWQVRAYNELTVGSWSRLDRLASSVDLHRVRAEIHRDHGRPGEAAEELRKALAVAPKDRDIARELAADLYAAREYDAARPMVEALLKAEPDAPDLLFLYGDMLLIAQEPARAIAPLKDAADRQPKLLGARASLGRAYLQNGEAALAIPHLEAALELDEDGSLHYQLAQAYQQTGNTERAAEMLKKYQELQKRGGGPPQI